MDGGMHPVAPSELLQEEAYFFVQKIKASSSDQSKFPLDARSTQFLKEILDLTCETQSS